MRVRNAVRQKGFFMLKEGDSIKSLIKEHDFYPLCEETMQGCYISGQSQCEFSKEYNEALIDED